ncbi:MAG: hypothetical protein HOK28_04895 [Deltaproteobacteria bacterium]|nr:hypothetical protein [Deltaproteobacteria bacterium]
MNTILFLVSALVMTPCGKITLDAQIGDNLDQVDGKVRCHDASTDKPALENYMKWLNERESASLDDVNTPWVYPRGYVPGSMAVRDAGAEHTYHFHSILPARAGTLGALNEVGYLLGGWHPVFSKKGIIGTVPISYTVHLPKGVGGLVGDKIYKPGPARTIRGDFEGKFLPLFLSRSFVVYKKGPYHLIANRQIPSAKQNRHIPYGLRDITNSGNSSSEREILKTLEMADDYAPPTHSDRRPIYFVMGPSRKTLCESFDGGILISDRAFQVLDWERLKRFHRNTLWRYVMQATLRDEVVNREAPEDVSWVLDFVSSSLRTKIYLGHYGKQEWATDVLSKFAVIPEIDALIHAPQVSLASTYFLSIDEGTGLDVELSRFGAHTAPGKLLQEKLLDQHGPEATFQLVQHYLKANSSFIAALEKSFGRPATKRLLPWLKPQYPQVDYFLESIHKTEKAIDISVGVRGQTSATDMITVESSIDGNPIRRQRLGPGKLSFPLETGDAQFTIDPESRLVEHLHPTGEESRYNNYRYPRWRFLLNNISGLFAVTNQELSLAADFSLRQVYDLRYRYRFSVYYTPVSIGGSAALAYGFGPKLNALRLSHALSIRTAYSYLRDEGIDLPTGHLGRLSLSYSHDTRISPYFAFEGRGWNTSISTGYHRTTAEPGVYGTASAAIFGILPLPGRQGLMGRLRVDGMVGNAPDQASLRLGGLYRGSRGYESDAARGDVFRALATIEHRHALFTAAKINFWGALMWTRLEGAFFANATYLPNHDSACGSPMFYDVGYGLRFIGDALNISPAAIVVDVGVPLTRCAKRETHQPVTVYLSFLQSLTSF